ncbi:MAG: condensation domain-containing protein, partial [Bdellovibrionales bacterium]
MVFIPSLDVSIGRFHFKEKQFVLSELSLTGARIGIKHYKEPREYNMQFLIDYFSSAEKDTTQSDPWKVKAKKIILNDCYLTYQDLKYIDVDHGIDWEDISLKKLNLEIEDLIGFFVNTLVLRFDLSGDPPFNVLLAQIRSTVFDAQNNQDFPFEQLVEVLQPERDMSYSPLFQVMFVLQNKQQQMLKLPDLEVSTIDNDSGVSKFDLTLHIHEEKIGLLTGVFEYSTDLFNSGTIAKFADHYLVLLQGIVTQPQTQISQLPFLTSAEKRKILIDWNDTYVDYPKEQCIHQIFETQVNKMPNAIAVMYEEQLLTYAELNAKANQLAHYLVDQG